MQWSFLTLFHHLPDVEVADAVFTIPRAAEAGERTKGEGMDSMRMRMEKMICEILKSIELVV